MLEVLGAASEYCPPSLLAAACPWARTSGGSEGAAWLVVAGPEGRSCLHDCTAAATWRPSQTQLSDIGCCASKHSHLQRHAVPAHAHSRPRLVVAKEQEAGTRASTPLRRSNIVRCKVSLVKVYKPACIHPCAYTNALKPRERAGPPARAAWSWIDCVAVQTGWGAREACSRRLRPRFHQSWELMQINSA